MSATKERTRILFLCTGNSCRSQMAEGWARALHDGALEVSSAGTHPGVLDPRAVRVMAEAGVDIAAQWPKHVDSLAGHHLDVVVTVCDAARGACPVPPAATRFIHHGFDDPPRLARDAPNEAEALRHYRRVRDQIRAFIQSLPETLVMTTDKSTTNSTADRSCCSDDCCAPGSAPSSAEDVRANVREGYAQIARSGGWNASPAVAAPAAAPAAACCTPGAAGGCCGPATFSPEQLASAIGYSAEELATAPDGANMGLSCGNPTALASLRPGEIVLDLGAGGGFDCFVAGPKVGATGRVIGVDMTADMVTKARRNLDVYARQTGLRNVEFRLGEIEHLPVADASVDCVISNCVINLSPDKEQVWREIARVLRPGGRVAVSDLALLRPLPQSVRQDVEALVGCIAGAALVEETRHMASAAGLDELTLESKPDYIDAMTNWEDPLYRRIVAALPQGSKPSDFITSLNVTARKPAPC